MSLSDILPNKVVEKPPPDYEWNKLECVNLRERIDALECKLERTRIEYDTMTKLTLDSVDLNKKNEMIMEQLIIENTELKRRLSLVSESLDILNRAKEEEEGERSQKKAKEEEEGNGKKKASGDLEEKDEVNYYKKSIKKKYKKTKPKRTKTQLTRSSKGSLAKRK